MVCDVYISYDYSFSEEAPVAALRRSLQSELCFAAGLLELKVYQPRLETPRMEALPAESIEALNSAKVLLILESSLYQQRVACRLECEFFLRENCKDKTIYILPWQSSSSAEPKKLFGLLQAAQRHPFDRNPENFQASTEKLAQMLAQIFLSQARPVVNAGELLASGPNTSARAFEPVNPDEELVVESIDARIPEFPTVELEEIDEPPLELSPEPNYPAELPAEFLNPVETTETTASLSQVSHPSASYAIQTPALASEPSVASLPPANSIESSLPSENSHLSPSPDASFAQGGMHSAATSPPSNEPVIESERRIPIPKLSRRQLMFAGGGIAASAGISIISSSLSWKDEEGEDEFGRWAIAKVGEVYFTMRYIPAGSFVMGADNAGERERPAHKVTLTEDFWMCEVPCPQRLWTEVMYTKADCRYVGPDKPVENVSWSYIALFIENLRVKLPSLKADIPSEAQWEYACRGGTQQIHYSNLEEYAWYENLGGRGTKPVKLKRPNSFGLYDMLGNVFERCRDFTCDYGDPYHYSLLPSYDPVGPNAGHPARVMRGGCWS